MKKEIESLNILSKSLLDIQQVLDGEKSHQLVPLLGHPVDLSDTKECYDILQKILNTVPPNPADWEQIRIKFTWGISFQGKDLSSWIQKNVTGNVDEIRIVLGLYTQNYVNTHHLPPEHVGRLTAFLWLFNSSQPNTPISHSGGNDAYNLGGLHP